MATIRKDGLCRKCLTAKANTSGYCSPCRRDLRAGKLCTKCKVNEQHRNHGGLCSKCRYEQRATSLVCEKCKGPKTIRGAYCNTCCNERRRNAIKCTNCSSDDRVSHGMCYKCRKKYREARVRRECGLLCECGRGTKNRSLKCPHCTSDDYKKRKRFFVECQECGCKKTASTVRRCKKCVRPKQDIRLIKVLAKKYGCDASVIASMKQQSSCEICQQQGIKPFIDHCHQTGKVRGVLCRWCNCGIGFFNDSIELLEKAIDYIESPRVPVEGVQSTVCACGKSRRGDSLTCQKCKNRYRKGKCSMCDNDSEKWGTCRDCKQTREIAKKLGISFYLAKRCRKVSTCEICNSSLSGNANIDHCHATGIMRGVLCNKCNSGLGMLMDNVMTAKNAIKYLQHHKARL